MKTSYLFGLAVVLLATAGCQSDQQTVAPQFSKSSTPADLSGARITNKPIQDDMDPTQRESMWHEVNASRAQGCQCAGLPYAPVPKLAYDANLNALAMRQAAKLTNRIDVLNNHDFPFQVLIIDPSGQAVASTAFAKFLHQNHDVAGCLSILNKKATKLGVGAVYNPSLRKVIWVLFTQ